MRITAAAIALVAAAPPLSGAFLLDQPSRRTFGISSQRRGGLFSTTEDIFTTAQINGALSPDELAKIVKSGKKKYEPDRKKEQDLFNLAAIETRASTAAYLAQYEGQTGAAAVYTKLVENGVEVVNGYSGGANLPLLDQFHPDHPRHTKRGSPDPIRWITNSNENSAGHVAEGYAKAMPLNEEQLPVAVAIATSGPGVTNLITPLQDAICDGVPVVALCGQAATVAPKDAFQSAPAVDITRPCTKWSYQIKSAAEIPLVMDYAFYIARHGRPGPVFIDLPKDLQNQIISSDHIDAFVNTNLFSSSKTDDDATLARLAKKRDENGDVFQALQLGYASQGLPFEVTKHNNAYILQPVTEHTEGSYHADHNPSNRIFHGDMNAVNGQEDELVEGTLEVGSPLTKEVMDVIRRAKKPVIIAGQGCNDCPDELKEFAEALQIPVTSTLHALGVFDERHDLALNMLGMHGHPTPNFMIQSADLIICIGSRFDDRITGRVSDFIPEARKAANEGRGGVIHVDLRLTENAKQIRPSFFVHSTGKNFLRVMNQSLKDVTVKPTTGPWLKNMRELQEQYPVKIPKMADVDSKTMLSAQSAITELNRQLLEANRIEDLIVSTGVGVHQMVAAQLITWVNPRSMLSSGSLGTMGVALGYAIGAKLANGKKMVIAIDGDGSFNMTFTELKTLAEQGIPVKIMILDNCAQMMVEFWQELFHDRRLLAVRNERNPDYCILAQSFGIKSLYCDNEQELPEKMKDFLFSDPEEPVVFHVKIERTPCLPLVAPGQPLDDMILEDVNRDFEAGAAPS